MKEEAPDVVSTQGHRRVRMQARLDAARRARLVSVRGSPSTVARVERSVDPLPAVRFHWLRRQGQLASVLATRQREAL